MRVLVVTLAVFGGGKKGGGERYATELARALRMLGVDVDIAVVGSVRSFEEQPHCDSPPAPSSFARFLWMVRRADLIHVHQLNSPGFDYAALARMVFRTPLVLTDHGGGALTPGRAFGRARLRLIDAAGFVSGWSRRDIDPHGVIRANAVIFGGGDHLPDPPPFLERYDFGFVGRLLPHKGAHVAIKALPAGATLIMAGQVRDPAYYSELLRLAEGKRVTLVPDAPDAYVASLLKSVRYLLVPSVESYGKVKYSRPELLGLVALEALAAGTPVIGSDVGGLGEVLRMANQSVLPPGDVPSWSQALAQAMKQEIRVLRTEDFTWKAVAGRCLKLYKTLLDENQVVSTMGFSG